MLSDSLISPFVFPSLKRWQKQKEWRLSLITLVSPVDVTNTNTKRWSEPPITSPSSTKYAYSPANPVLYHPLSSAPIYTPLRQETPDLTKFALCDSPEPSLLSSVGPYYPSSEPIQRQLDEGGDLTPLESPTSTPPDYATSYSPSLPPSVRTQIRKESRDTGYDSPSIYSTMTASEDVFPWDTTGDIIPSCAQDPFSWSWNRTMEYYNPAFSTSEFLVSPLTSSSLKRRSHIRRKERPWRMSLLKLVSFSDDINTYQSELWSDSLQTPTSTQYAYSPQTPVLSYAAPVSAPIRTNVQHETPGKQDRIPLRGRLLPGPAAPYNSPFSEPIRADQRLEVKENEIFAPFDSRASIPALSGTSYNPHKLPPIQTDLRKESRETLPDSPSIYSTMTASETLSFDWDTTGGIGREVEGSDRDTESFHWSLDAIDCVTPVESRGRMDIKVEPIHSPEPRNDRAGLTRQNTAVIVKLLRERRRKAERTRSLCIK